MAKQHLNEEQRETIQFLLNQKKSFTYIGKSINADRTTIAKEIKRNRYIKSYFYPAFDEKAKMLITKKCEKLSSPPYVCNTCPNKGTCTNHKLYYNSKLAHNHYKECLVDSRKGIDLKPETLDQIEHIIVPLIKDKKQSVNQVFINHSDILYMSKPTFYKYVNDGVFSLTNLDLPKKVVYAPRKEEKNTDYKRKLAILKGRKYEDYLKFISNHPSMNKVQLDTVIGKAEDSKCLLTMYIVKTHFMLIFLLDKKDISHVSDIFKTLKNKLSIQDYKKIFRIILTDNGSEFLNPYEMEYDYESNKKVCNVFYCRPYSSWQKHEIEVNHEYIRRVLPKGTSFDNLTDAEIKKLQDNINNIPRVSILNKTPHSLTQENFPKLISTLDCKFIDKDDVSLNKSDILNESNLHE